MTWIVHTIGSSPPQSDHMFTYFDPDIGSSNIEVSVLKDDNVHGKLSLGWGGPTKFIVACMTPIPPQWLLSDIITIAQKLADRLNANREVMIPSYYVERI